MSLKNRNSSILDKVSNAEDIAFIKSNDEGVLLLLEQPKESIEILKTIGFDYHISKVEKEIHVKNSKIQLSKLYNRKSFLGSDIKKVCNEYDLTISRVVNYTGAPFSDLPKIINDFIEEYSEIKTIPAKYKQVEVPKLDDEGNEQYWKDDGQLKTHFIDELVKEEEIKKVSKIGTSNSNWFIMAPREAFDCNTKNTCCTLFYRDDDNSRSIDENDVFLEIYSWGSSYSDFRKYNYFTKYIPRKEEIQNKRNISWYDYIDEESQSILFYILLFLFFISFLLYKLNFTLGVYTQSIILFVIYLYIRKKNKNYMKLWKI